MTDKRMPWFRMYTDFLNDPKMIALAFEDQRHFIGVLALKSDGALDSGCPSELLDRIVAQRLWIDHAVIREVKRRLMAARLISDDWQPLAWDKRQFASDSSKERVAKFRAKQKAATFSDTGNREGGAHGNGDETLLKRKSNAVDTDTDTEDVVKELDLVGGNDAAFASPEAPPTADAPVEPKTKTACRLPDDWVLPKSWGDWALAERPDFSADDVRREAECFADHWHAKAGADARKVSWQGTWRNWVRRASGMPRLGQSSQQRHEGVGAFV